MSLYEKIKSDLGKALKVRDPVGVSALRFLLAQIQNQEIELKKRGKLTDEEILAVIRKQAKKHQESIEAYQKGERADLVQKEKAELEILNTYLPQMMSPSQLEKIIRETIDQMGTTEKADFGQVMQAVMIKVKGMADGKEVAAMVRKLI